MFLILAKRLSENQKKELTKLFSFGQTIAQLSEKFNCTKLTISRNLKKILGEKEYDEIKKNFTLSDRTIDKDEKRVSEKNNINKENYKNKHTNIKITTEDKSEETFPINPFIEITPLNYDIESSSQKDLSSVPILEVDFPKVVYMIVEKNIELQTKYLKDYPDWQFLSKDELNRKTIEIYFDLKSAKRFCNKEAKVIKVPNTEVFKIVAPLLLSRGISRIVSSDKLIAL